MYPPACLLEKAPAFKELGQCSELVCSVELNEVTAIPPSNVSNANPDRGIVS